MDKHKAKSIDLISARRMGNVECEMMNGELPVEDFSFRVALLTLLSPVSQLVYWGAAVSPLTAPMDRYF